jgi:hypothetical protein
MEGLRQLLKLLNVAVIVAHNGQGKFIAETHEHYL